MALLTDYHFHTEISPDSRAPWPDMILAEYAAGVRELCVTDHCDLVDWKTLKYSPRCLEVPGRELEMYDKYAGRLPADLRLRLGIELGEAQMHPEALPGLMAAAAGLDFILGSCHMSKKYGDYYFLDYHDPAFRSELWDIYLNDLALLARLDFFDVMAHIGYWRRYAWQQGIDDGLTLARYGDRIEDLLRTLIGGGRGVEINCSGIRDGCGPFPSAEILSLYRSLGGEIITLGSDAHKPEDAAKCLAEGRDMLESLGFRYLTVFTKHKPEFIPIK